MRMVKIELIVVCPFDICREDYESKKMTPSCENCNYADVRYAKLYTEKDTIKLTEDSEEYKIWTKKYSHCTGFEQ